jgi:hypothetical protein
VTYGGCDVHSERCPRRRPLCCLTVKQDGDVIEHPTSSAQDVKQHLHDDRSLRVLTIDNDKEPQILGTVSEPQCMLQTLGAVRTAGGADVRRFVVHAAVSTQACDFCRQCVSPRKGAHEPSSDSLRYARQLDTPTTVTTLTARSWKSTHRLSIS